MGLNSFGGTWGHERNWDLLPFRVVSGTSYVVLSFGLSSQQIRAPGVQKWGADVLFKT